LEAVVSPAVHWPSVVRASVLFALAAILLHLFGANVGAWAAGSLGPLATLLIGVAAPAWFFVCFPSWFAWRIARPLHLRGVAGVACWFSPLVGRHDLASLRVFLKVEGGRPFPPADAIPADAWTALAAALQAERQGNRARARMIVDALACLPQESPFPWLARCHGGEALVLAAWARSDWRAVLDYAVIGRGRAVAWLALLAHVELGQRVPPRKLWLGWLQAPLRRRTWAPLRAALARVAVPAKVTPAPTATAPVLAEPRVGSDVRLRHVSLLAAASRGERIAAAEVSALARAWQSELDKAALARICARGLELDVADPARHAQKLRDGVLAELVVLAAACDGKLAAETEREDIVGEVAAGVRERLCRQVEHALDGVSPERYAPAIHPLEAWQRWLALRAALDRLGAHDSAALFALWNGRVAATAWNFTCAVFNHHPRRAGWVAHGMYQWLAEQAELQGDLRTAVINRENARIALAV
jgi:hypothetical protein